MILNGKHLFFIFLLFFALSITLYFPALNGDFLNWDDENYILKNYLLDNFSISSVFSTFFMGNYHPFTIISYFVEKTIFGNTSTAYHITNVFLHAINSVLVIIFSFLLTRKKYLGLTLGFIFCVHPMHVESVAWISERKDVLYACFYLSSLIFYTMYVLDKKIKWRYLLSLMFFIFSLFSKGQAVTLFGAIILVDFLMKKIELSRAYIINKLPFLVLSIIFGLIAIKAQGDAHAIDTFKVYSSFEKTILVFYSLALYLLKLVYPLNLAAIYPYPFQPSEVIASSVIILSLISILFLVCFWIFRTKRAILFGLLWFVITLIPVLQFVPVGEAIIADRYVYLSMIGLYFSFLFICNDIYLKLPKFKWLLLTLFSFYLSFLSYNTYKRSFVWNNKYDFWVDQINKYPEYGKSYNNLASYYHSEGKIDESKKLFTQALENKCYLAYLGLAVIEKEQNRNENALILINNAIKVFPYWNEAHSTRGIIHIAKKDYVNAIKDFKKCVSLNPNFGGNYSSLGDVYYLSEKYDSAVYFYNISIKMKYTVPVVYLNRGKAFIKLNKPNEAISDLETYINVNNFLNFEAYNKLSQIYFVLNNQKKGIEILSKFIDQDSLHIGALTQRAQKLFSYKNYTGAIVDFSRIISLTPTDVYAYNNRALSKQFLGDLTGAIEDYTTSIELDSNYVDGYYNRGRTYTLLNDDNRAISDYNKVLIISPNHSAAMKFLGLSYLKIGNSNMACSYFEKIKLLNYNGDLSMFKGVCN